MTTLQEIKQATIKIHLRTKSLLTMIEKVEQGKLNVVEGRRVYRDIMADLITLLQNLRSSA